MIAAFSALTLAVSIIFAVIYYMTIRKNYIETEYKNLQTAAENYAQQFSYSVEQMEEVVQHVLSDKKALDSIMILSHAKNGEKDKSYHYTEARAALRAALNTDYNKKNFNRVVLFMQNGNVISSTNYKYNPVEPGRGIGSLPWLDRMEGQRGKYVLLGMHPDDWSENGRVVISVIREIIGENLGYLEVQKDVDSLDELFVPGNPKWELLVFQDDRLLYGSNKEISQEEIKMAAAALEEENNAAGKKAAAGEKIINENGELLALSTVWPNRLRIAVIDHTRVSQEAMKAALPMALLIVIMMGGGSFGCIYLVSRRMVKPIRQLKQQMESTDIDNLKIAEPVRITDPEIGKLYGSYEQVLQKLDQSIKKERFLSELQQKAQFDLLQAQVNPHFLFNVLNVISSRGAEAEDETICDICADLAQMLRYSTDVKEKKARLREEVHYLKLYLSLLKFRYEDMLEYEISIEEKMEDLEIPKMVLQQLVENSISHGYQDVDRVRKIGVFGSMSEEKWMIRVRDNGIGMTEETIQKIVSKCAEVREALSEKRRHVEMGIGGMGLINTYARLFQIYGSSFFMEITPLSEGVEVSIGVRKEGENVSGTCSG